MNGFLNNFCSNIGTEIANYTSPYNVYENENYLFEAIIQAYKKNNFPRIIFNPMCRNNHWTLVLIDIERRRYLFYDPLSNKSSRGDMMITKTIVKLREIENITLEFYEVNHDRQSGGWECGYHVLLFCYKYAMGQSHNTPISQIINFRRYLIEIVNKTFQ